MLLSPQDCACICWCLAINISIRTNRTTRSQWLTIYRDYSWADLDGTIHCLPKEPFQFDRIIIGAGAQSLSFCIREYDHDLPYGSKFQMCAILSVHYDVRQIECLKHFDTVCLSISEPQTSSSSAWHKILCVYQIIYLEDTQRPSHWRSCLIWPA